MFNQFQSINKEKKKVKIESDEEKMLKIMLNEMKKKISFVDKTNWMFNDENFQLEFLELYFINKIEGMIIEI